MISNKNEPDIGLNEIGKAVRALKGWKTCGNMSKRNRKSQEKDLWQGVAGIRVYLCHLKVSSRLKGEENIKHPTTSFSC